MASGAIVINLVWCGSRQAVSVRPIGLSCVEAVKDWVASLRRTPEPFEIAGLKYLATGQVLWANELPDNLGPGIPQELLQAGAEYEVIIGAPVRHMSAIYPPASPMYIAPAFAPAYDFEPALPLPSPSKGPYRVAHPFHGGVDSAAPSRNVTNVYYLDEYGNRIPAPAVEYGQRTPRASRSPARSPKAASNHQARSQSPPQLARSASTGDLWDRLAQPMDRTPRHPEPQSARKPPRSREERQEVVERLLAPRTAYEPEDGEDEWDPNLRTVYRKMTPEDLDMFVYRMYAPHKHSAPRRDIYDEHKELVKRMNTFRDDVPSTGPPMDFRRPDPEYEDDELPLETKKLTEEERAAMHLRLYEQAKAKRERQRLREEDKVRAEVPTVGSRKLSPAEFKAMHERMIAKKKPPPHEDFKPQYGGTPVPKPKVRKNIERLTKPRVFSQEPAQPNECSKVKKVKMSYDHYQKLLEKLMLPNAREKLWREKHPVEMGQKRMEREKMAGNANKWKTVW